MDRGDYKLTIGSDVSNSAPTPVNPTDIANKQYVDGVQAQVNELEEANAIDPNTAEAQHAATYLKIPTPDGTFQTVHPSVVYFPKGWNGWKYWMVHTPYANADDTKEIPCIAVSNDRISWQEPTGITNPIVGPSATGHYADPDMIFFNGKLHITYLDTGDFWYINSADGVTWSTPVSISADVPHGLSPSFLKDGDKFITYHVNDNVSPRVVCRAESSSFLSGWSVAEEITFNNFPVGYNPWHLEVKKYKTEYHMMLNCRVDGGNSNILIFGTSQDGKTFDLADNFLLEPLANNFADDRLYKSSMVLISEYKYALWYSAVSSTNEWRVGYTEANFGDVISQELTESIGFSLSDENSALTASTSTPVVTIRSMPFSVIIDKVFLTVGSEVPTGAALIVDVKKNGVSIFGTLPRIDDGGSDSDGSATPQVINDNYLFKGDKLEFFITQVGSTATGKGLKAFIQ